MLEKIQKAVFKKYLGDDEEIIFTTHNHFFSTLGKILGDVIIWMVIPTTLIIFDIFVPYVIYLYFIGIPVILYHLYDWYADAFVITNKGIINVVWNGFTQSNSQRVQHVDIVVVNIEKSNFLQSIFNYGKLIITVSDGSRLSIDNAINPEKAQGIIIKQKELNLANDYSDDSISPTDLRKLVKNINRKRKPTAAEKKGFVTYEVEDEEEV